MNPLYETVPAYSYFPRELLEEIDNLASDADQISMRRYLLGYAKGRYNVPQFNPGVYNTDPFYLQGYEDGVGDHALG